MTFQRYSALDLFEPNLTPLGSPENTYMDKGTIVDLLEELAETLGLRVRYESIRPGGELGNRPGGFCLLRGEPMLIIDPDASAKEKIKILSEAVKRFDIDRIYIPPVLRELLDRIPEQSPLSISGNDGCRLDEKQIDFEE